MDWENHFERKEKKTGKNVKFEVKLANLDKKPLSRKQIFVPTPFSFLTLKLE